MESYNQLIEALIRTSESIKRDIDSLLSRRFDIRLAQFKLLYVMQKHGGGLEQQTIAKSCHQSEASVSRQIGVLADKGLIRVALDSKNKRVHSIVFTEKGVRLIDDATLAIEEMMAIKMHNFSAAECQAFGRLLQKF